MTAINSDLSREEILRYSRHLLIPQVGMAGQKKLRDSAVLVIGVGGLGSPASMYLAAAGVGRIGIVDHDTVELSNLHRQLLHSTRDIGRSKLLSAESRLADVNPYVKIVSHDARLSSANAMEILAGYDVIVDGTDNFPTRYLVNDACVILGKPYVYGSIFRFDGQVSVFDAARGPCYRCLFPSPPPPGLVPSCAEGGVLGVLPGVIGSLQALEAIKLLLGKGETLTGRLVLFDALHLSFRELKLRKSASCPVCGDKPTITALIDYEEFCGLTGPSVQADSNDMSVEELRDKLDKGDDLELIDVREPNEYELVSMGGRLIPLNELPSRMAELDGAKEIVVHCKSGVRSKRAVELLKSAGFTRVKSLSGGIDAWAERIDPSILRY